MTSDTKGRRTAHLAAPLLRLAALSVLLLVPVLSACTTVEGTNALVDAGTFEREVMVSNMQGLAILPQDAKKPDPQPRAPLVMPKQVGQLPAPRTANADDSAIPTDSTNPQINTAGLSEADVKRLRNARVVDLQSVSGRPLTDTERKQLTARMAAANVTPAGQGTRALTLPPVSYFSDYKGRDMVCRANDGTLVALDDKRCPQSIRDAMRRQAPTATSITQAAAQQMKDMREGTIPDPAAQ